MCRRLWLACLPLSYALLAACVGDNPAVEGGGNDGGPGGGHDGTLTDGSSSGSPGDGGPGADAEPLCGYPGEDCCAPPALPCRAGTICGISNQKCMISSL